MLRKQKLRRSGKLRGNRRVYVSVILREGEKDHTEWFKRFWEMLELLTRQNNDIFVGVLQTNNAETGVVLSERLGAASPVTDVISVLTVPYLNANLGDSGELVYFVDERTRQEAAKDPENQLQIFLAMLDTLEWSIKIRKIPLSDRRFTRLRDNRFTWPSESPGSVADQVKAAVYRIVEGS
jgi:hypothetical protein